MVAAQYAAGAAAACQPPATAPYAGRRRPARLVEMDDARVRSHDNALGMEANVRVVHSGSERIGRGRTRLTQRRYAATFGGVGEFGPLVTTAVEARNGRIVLEQTLLGDAATWISVLGRAILTEATPVLDRWRLADARQYTLRRPVPEEDQRGLERGEVPGGRRECAGAVRG